MQSEQLDVYLSWVRERGLRYPVRRTPRVDAPADVAFISATPLTSDERALLDKMIAAMKLPAAQARVVDDPASAPPPASLRLCILLGGAAAPAGCPAVRTFHPGELLREPAKKRQAWADLQGAMAMLGLG